MSSPNITKPRNAPPRFQVSQLEVEPTTNGLKVQSPEIVSPIFGLIAYTNRSFGNIVLPLWMNLTPYRQIQNCAMDVNHLRRFELKIATFTNPTPFLPVFPVAQSELKTKTVPHHR